MAKTKLRLKPNSIILILIIILGFFVYEANTYNSDATGFYVINSQANPTKIFLFNNSVEFTQVSATEWRPFQKYTVNEHRYCVLDCQNFAAENNYEVIRSHSRKWGQCLCEVEL
jgi:hypothetical protein